MRAYLDSNAGNRRRFACIKTKTAVDAERRRGFDGWMAVADACNSLLHRDR